MLSMGRVMDSNEDKSLQDLLSDYLKLEKLIKNRLTRRSVVLFSDVFESTPFFDKYGDFEGLKWLQECYNVVFPEVEARGGEVLKTTGDGVMAKFETTDAAVEAAMAIQWQLGEDNRKKTEEGERHRVIRIRVGIHGGSGVEKESDVFGRFVNASARIQSLADPDQVLISEEVYSRLSDELKAKCIDLGLKEIKGQSDPMRVYSVEWDGISQMDSGRTDAAALPVPAEGRRGCSVTLSVAFLAIIALAAGYWIAYLPVHPGTEPQVDRPQPLGPAVSHTTPVQAIAPSGADKYSLEDHRTPRAISKPRLPRSHPASEGGRCVVLF